MDHESALLCALHADPSDETTWLALADCLEEQGQPERAELVRLRLALRHTPLGRGREALEARVFALLFSGVRPCVPEVVNSVGMRLALITAGSFWMGAPRAEAHRDDGEERHEVELTRPFYIGVHTVTQEQFTRVIGRNPSHFRPDGTGKEHVRDLDTSSFPVDSVTWHEAVEFCRKLSELPAEQAAQRTYRLPTEAEWEYSCRAGTSSPFHFGPALSSKLANVVGQRPYGMIEPGPTLNRTCAVGLYPPNAWGLQDMHGNVWEWCQDWFSRDAYHTSARKDPHGPLHGDSRVLRGGSYNFEAWLARAATRVCYAPSHRAAHDGFRVVMTVSPIGRMRDEG